MEQESDKILTLNDGTKIPVFTSAAFTYPQARRPVFEDLKRRITKQNREFCDCCKRYRDQGHKIGCGNGNINGGWDKDVGFKK
jgi:hypothetical protein